jgi:DNA-binding MarR family transcriptional regulator
MASHQPGLDESIGFVLGVTYRKISAFLASRLRELDITPEQWSVLYRIGEKDGQIQKDIAERAGKDHPTTTRILDGLAAKGFIEKRAGQRDRRSFEVFMTERGRSTLDRATPIEHAAMEEACAGITREEREALRNGLAAINLRVDRLNGRGLE